MIDVENRVYTKVSEAIPGVDMHSVNPAVIEKLPCVAFYELDNFVYTPSITLDNRENHAVITFEANVYSLKKTEAKEIAEIVDNVMSGMGFVRMVKTVAPNIDRTVYRLTMRWEGVVDTGRDNGSFTEHMVYKR